MPGGLSSFDRVPTLCNQVLSHPLADILQTLHSCYGHIKDVHVRFWKRSDIFIKNLHVVELSHFSSIMADRRASSNRVPTLCTQLL
jgi:hypothetical protein